MPRELAIKAAPPPSERLLMKRQFRIVGAELMQRMPAPFPPVLVASSPAVTCPGLRTCELESSDEDWPAGRKNPAVTVNPSTIVFGPSPAMKLSPRPEPAQLMVVAT